MFDKRSVLIPYCRLGDCAKDAVSRSVDNKLKEMGVVLSKGEIKLGSFAESRYVGIYCYAAFLFKP